MGAERNPGAGREMGTPQHGRQGQQLESRDGHSLSPDLFISIFQRERRCKSCSQPRFELRGCRDAPGESLLSVPTAPALLIAPNPSRNRLSPHSQRRFLYQDIKDCLDSCRRKHNKQNSSPGKVHSAAASGRGKGRSLWHK